MRNALKIDTEGQTTRLDLDAAEGSLKVMQTAVEGLIEPIDLKADLCMYVNEEFLYVCPEANFVATRLARNFVAHVPLIKGNVILTGGVDREGDTLGLTEAQVELFEQYAERLKLVGLANA
jgi:hypothetical protein